MDFKELTRLYHLGFALHWCRARSKAPLEARWASGPRRTIKELKDTYRAGSNVGVRLGAASKTREGFLAVIDVDVKSTNPRHRIEAEERVRSLFPEIEGAPRVESGRGGGSCHYYVCLEKPTRGGDRKGQSRETVKVHMPSTKPSARETAELTPAEIESGLRLRCAWEISLMSEGRQVVLPGSIHPDTGGEYRWTRPVDIDGINIPLIILGEAKPAVASGDSPGAEDKSAAMDFDFTTPDVSVLKPQMLASLVSMDGVTDRSATAFGVAQALARRGFSEIDIVSVLTDRARFALAQFAYDRRSSRKSAAQWVLTHTVRKAMEIIRQDSGSLFEPLAPDAAASGAEWIGALEKRGTPPRIIPSFLNVLAILTNTAPKCLGHDTFADRSVWLTDTPWGSKEGELQRDADAVMCKAYLVHEWRVEPSVALIEECFAKIREDNKFHPVRDFLGGLKWDGVARIDAAFSTYLGATEDRQYLAAVSRKFFLSLVARVREPGIAIEWLPVLEGGQGIGKSSFGRILVGEAWFADSLPPLQDKDAGFALQGRWLVEMGELAALKRSDLESAKAFITRNVDKARAAYARHRSESPRQNVFLGTTNADEYLADTTGNRRFCPVSVTALDFEKLSADREQLFAEADHIWKTAREPLWLSGAAKTGAEAARAGRLITDESDVMLDHFQTWADTEEGRARISSGPLKLTELFSGPPFGLVMKADTKTLRFAGRVLRRAGFVRKDRREGRHVSKVWERPLSASQDFGEVWFDEPPPGVLTH